MPPRGPRGPRGGGYRGYNGGGYNGGMGTQSGTFHYRMQPPDFMGAGRRSRRDGLLEQTAAERLGERRYERIILFDQMQADHGYIKGTINAIRCYVSGGIRKESCFAKCEQAKKEFEAGKITNNVYIKRCINAHKKYASYLVKIGYFDEDDYVKYMSSVCAEHEVEYEYNPEGGRTK